MSVAAILNTTTGKIVPVFLPTAPSDTYVENPMIANLDGGGVSITNANVVTVGNVEPTQISDSTNSQGLINQILTSTGTAIQWDTISRNVGDVGVLYQGPFTGTGQLGAVFTIPKSGLYIFQVYVNANSLVFAPQPGTEGVLFLLEVAGGSPVPNSSIVFTYDELTQYSNVLGGLLQDSSKYIIINLPEGTYTLNISTNGTPSGGTLDIDVFQFC